MRCRGPYDTIFYHMYDTYIISSGRYHTALYVSPPHANAFVLTKPGLSISAITPLLLLCSALVLCCRSSLNLLAAALLATRFVIPPPPSQNTYSLLTTVYFLPALRHRFDWKAVVRTHGGMQGALSDFVGVDYSRVHGR